MEKRHRGAEERVRRKKRLTRLTGWGIELIDIDAEQMVG